MKTLSINSQVRIKLTSRGIKKLKRKHIISNFTPPKVDKDGYYEMQLWQVMNIFGGDMIASNPSLPFEPNIQIDDAEFKSED